MASNTVTFVINRAIELAQLDSSFLTLARNYYNLILKDLAGSTDFPYYRSEAAPVSFVAGQRSYDLPTDYNRSDTCYLVDISGNRRQIIIKAKYEFDQLRGATINGDPNLAYIDNKNRLIVFNNVPSDSSKSYVLTYHRSPEDIDTAGGNDSDEVDCENVMYLVYKLTSILMDYSDDERAMVFDQKAQKIFRDDQLNAWDEDNDSKLQLGPSFRAGRRPMRSSGF
jgi:hypothetical protein